MRIAPHARTDSVQIRAFSALRSAQKALKKARFLKRLCTKVR
jgi:hypothetical protein